jgi:uncharacterized protein YrrD
MRLSEADGRPVISRASAERLGELRHVVVDAAGRRITALHVAGRKRRARLVDWGTVVGFGPDGIVVDGDGAVREPSGEREQAVVSGDLDLDGRLVLDDRGRALGPLEDVLFDPATGLIDGLLAGGATVEGARLRAIGPFCVLVRAEEPGGP